MPSAGCCSASPARRRSRPADPRVTRQVCPAREPPTLSTTRERTPRPRGGSMSQDTDDTQDQDPDAGHEGRSITLQLGNQELVLRRRYELLSVLNDIGIFLAFTIG